MAKLTKAARAAIPTSKFAGPHRSFPIPDASHARAALSMAHYASNPAAVKAKVHAAYPGIGHQSGLKSAHQSHPNASRLGKYLHARKG